MNLEKFLFISTIAAVFLVAISGKLTFYFIFLKKSITFLIIKRPKRAENASHKILQSFFENAKGILCNLERIQQAQKI
jgi:hypothetical protein